MAARAPILAGKTVILLQLQDNIDTALASVKKRINKFSNSINKISFELFTGGLATGLIPARTLKDFKDLEDRLLFLSTKLDVTDEQMLTVTNRIRDLGRTTSFTANEVADGAAVLAQAGLNADQVMSTLGATLDLARGNAITLEQSGAILANTMTVFSIAGDKAGEVASQFTRAARLGTLDVLDLKESLKEVVGTLDNLNIDLPTSLALVTQLAQSSLKGTKAGTSLNTALLQLASKKDVLKNTLGIGIEDAQGNLRPILDILDELLLRLNKMGDVSRLAVVQRLFNIRGGRAVQGLLRDLGNVRTLAKDIRTAGNEARDAAIKMDSGFGGAVRKTTNSLLSLSFAIGKIVGGPLTTFLRIVPTLTFELEKLAVANPTLVLTLAAIPPALIAIGATGLVASYGLAKLGGVIGVIGAGFKVTAGIINTQFTRALIGVLAIRRQFGKSFLLGIRLLGPLGILITIVTILGARLGQLGSGIKTAFSEIFKVGTLLKPIFTLIGASFKSIGAGEGALGIKQLTEGFQLMVDIIGTQLTLAWSRLIDSIRPALDFMQKMIASTIELGKLFGKLTGLTIGTGFSAVSSAVNTGSGGSGSSSLISDLFASINFKDIFSNIARIITKVAEGILSIIKFMATSVIETMIGIQKFLLGLSKLPGLGLAGQSGVFTIQISRLESALRNSNIVFASMPAEIAAALETTIGHLGDIFDPVFKPNPTAVAQGQAFAQFGAAQAAVDAAAKREQQRVDKPLGRFENREGRKPIADAIKAAIPQYTLDQLRQQRRDLSFELSSAKATGNVDAIPVLQEYLRGVSVDLQAATRQSRLDALGKKPLGGFPQGNIKDVVAATVGSIQATRFNRFKVANEDPAREQVGLLQDISAQLGPTTQDSYLKKLTEKAGPLTFTK